MTIKTRTLAAKPEPANDTAKRKTLTRARKAEVDKASQVQNTEVQDVASTQQLAPAAQPAPDQSVELPGLDQPVTGRGVFAVRTLGNAVSVESAFLAEDGNVLRLPAVFPNREYARAQIEELLQLVNRHFDDLEQAAKAANAAS